MLGEIPRSDPEKKEVLDDNARKFTTEPIDSEFLKAHGASSFTLTTDWLEMDEDNEKKLAYKKYDSGDIQILLISKVTKNGSRTSEKEKITAEEYRALLDSAILHLEKKRYEFTYLQNDIPFSVKYDEFTDSKLRILEVDAANEETRDSFDPEELPMELAEVTGDMKYYGYRVASVV